MSDISLSEFLHNPTHHAYLIIGDRDAHFEKTRLLVREKVVAETLHPADVWSRTYEAVGIDDAREIKEIQNTMPIGDKRIVLISISTIQSEAQNSLLKLFEEPSAHTTFFVFARSSEIFLPTLLSRFNIVTIGSASEQKSPRSDQAKAVGDIDVKKFLSSTIAGRLDLLEPIITDKDKDGAENFLNALEGTLYSMNKMSGKRPTHQTAAIFEDIFAARRFLRSRSPSVKMILEHLSGSIPMTQ